MIVHKTDASEYPHQQGLQRDGAVPSIFPWTVNQITNIMDETPEKTVPSDENVEDVREKIAPIGVSSDASPKKEMDKNEIPSTNENVNKPKTENLETVTMKEELPLQSLTENNLESSGQQCFQPKMIIDVIHSIDEGESVAKDSDVVSPQNVSSEFEPTTSKHGQKRKNKKSLSLDKSLNSDDKDQNDSAFSVGKRIEAKDYGEVWHPARIVEVDSDEIEVLVHYDNWSQRHDEWISMSSPRIRSLSSLAASPSQSGAASKTPITYKVGEQCLARWTDNRRFPATVRSVVGNGKYEMIFDDGYILVCQWYSLSKIKKKKSAPTAANSTIPLQPSTSQKKSSHPLLPPDPLPPVPFHRHLFDPSRDYLGPKSERREMKRKLDVKALFNIGRRNSTNINTLKRKKPEPIEVPPAKKKKKRGRKKKDSLLIKPEIIDEAQIKLPKLKKEVEVVIKEEIKNEPIEVSVKSPILDVKTEPEKPLKAIIELKETEKQFLEKDIEGKDNIKIINADILGTGIHAEKEVIATNKSVKPQLDKVLINSKSTKKKSNRKSRKQDLNTESISDEINKKAIDLDVPECAISLESDDRGVANVTTNNIANNTSTEVISDASAEPSVIKAEDGTLQLVIHPLLDENKPECAADYATDEHIENQDNYTMGIDDGLKLIAEAVESFSRNAEADLALKTNLEEQSSSNVEESENTELQPTTKYPEAVPEEGQWCCRWVNGEPQGVPHELDMEQAVKGGGNFLPRKSVLVEDKRLPPGWRKILVRRSSGTSAGKWDIVLIEPAGKRLRDKGEMRNFLSLNKTEELMTYENILMDFSVHRKLSRRLGWDMTTSHGGPPAPLVALRAEGSGTPRPAAICPPAVTPVSLDSAPMATPTSAVSPKPRLMLKLKKRAAIRTPPSDGPPSKKKKKKSVPAALLDPAAAVHTPTAGVLSAPATPLHPVFPPAEGYVYVGSLKVQIIENLFRCPADGCFKNFRKDNLLRMHIKHYHRELRKFLGSTPKVSDLAYARTAIPEDTVIPKLKCEGDNKIVKPKPAPKTPTTPIDKIERKDSATAALHVDTTQDIQTTPVKSEASQIPVSLQDSPKLRSVLENPLPVKRPKVLYPVKKLEIKSEQSSPRSDDKLSRSHTPDVKPKEDMEAFVKLQKLPDDVKPKMKIEQQYEVVDFEKAISSHTVTKPVYWNRSKKTYKKSKLTAFGSSKPDKKKGKYAVPTPAPGELDAWDVSDLETVSSFGTPDSRSADKAPDALAEPATPPAPSAPPTHTLDPDVHISDTGEKIKIVRMKREEIINCHCGFSEEDGLMIQCELCLCWQHAICHSIESEAQVPDKYTCSICLNPRRGRRSRRFLHDQAWLYEGALPGGAPDAALRRSHELTANLLRLSHALQLLKLKFQIAEKKDHPKLYLWAKDWESAASERAEPLPHVDLRDVFGELGKENLPLKEEDMKDVSLGDIKSSLSEDVGYNQKDDGHLGSLANLLSSPGGPSLDLPISTSELERLAKSVQESDVGRSAGPEPEAAIESGACRKNLLKHILRCQLLIDARLDSIEAQVAELESQEPSLEDDETAEYFPRTKQTIQMLHRDLNTLEELGAIT